MINRLTPVAFNVTPDMVAVQLRLERPGLNPILLNGATWPANARWNVVTVIAVGSGRRLTFHEELDPETPDGLINLMFAALLWERPADARAVAEGWEAAERQAVADRNRAAWDPSHSAYTIDTD